MLLAPQVVRIAPKIAQKCVPQSAPSGSQDENTLGPRSQYRCRQVRLGCTVVALLTHHTPMVEAVFRKIGNQLAYSLAHMGRLSDSPDAGVR